jgi:hypothetical protein
MVDRRLRPVDDDVDDGWSAVVEGSRRVVFTALIGDYENLLDQPIAAESDVDFICFTDSPELVSNVWRVIVIEPMLPLDPVRSQRAIKIRGHEALHEYDEWLYIDNSVLLKQRPELILDRWLADGEFAVSPHSFRESVLDEFDAVLELGYDDAARVTEQLQHYAELKPSVLAERPYWNGMFARRNVASVHEMTSRWFDHVLRYSRRDQLSANMAFSAGTVAITVIDEQNNDSDSHQWPAGVGRKAHLTIASRRRSGPLLAEIRHLQLQIAELERLLADAKLVEDAKLRETVHELEAGLAYARSRHASAIVLFGRRTVTFMERVLATGRRLVPSRGDARQKR